MANIKKKFKVLTNIRFMKLAGIAQTLTSFVEYVNETQKKIEFIGVDVERNNDDPEKCEFRRKDIGQMILNHAKLGIPTIKEALKSSKNIDEYRAAFSSVTDYYKRCIEQEKPDVVLINGTYYLPWCLLQATRDMDLPVVCHYHGSITKETENYDDHARGIFMATEKEFFQKNTFFVFPSELARSTVEKDIFGKPIDHAVVIPNPIPLHFFDDRRRKGDKSIGFVGRWSYVKNLDLLQKFVKYSVKQDGDYALRFVTDLREGTKDWKAIKDVVFLRSPMANKRLASFYRNLTVLINPSHFETYGNVAQEAIAAGTPALVNNNMGVAEIFRRVGLDDMVIDYDSEEHVFEAISRIGGSRVPEKIRARVRRLLSPQVVYDKLINVIRPAVILVGFIEAIVLF